MDLFEFIEPNKNDFISEMCVSERNEFLELLKQYKIFLKPELGISNDITFGFELEFSTLNQSIIESLIKTYSYELILSKRNKYNGFWASKEERTIKNGFEVTTPIFTDTPENWTQLCEVCKILLNNNSYITNETAGHIHIGTQILGNSVQNWINFFKLYVAYENILFRFGYGEYEKERLSLTSYSASIARLFNNRLSEFEKRNYNISLEELFVNMQFGYKKYALGIHKPVKEDTSFKERKTIEFRSFNASLEPVIWQNNLNFIVHFMKYAMSTKYDEDTVNKRINNIKDYCSYNIIDLEQALELADMIFDNNLDKMNFLRQYLKSFKTKDEFVVSDKFIKSLHL